MVSRADYCLIVVDYSIKMFYNTVVGGGILKYIEYSEKKKHGKYDFPLQYYYVNDKHEQYVMPLHWHRELELIRVRTGKIKIYLNNIPYTVNAGEQLIIQGGTLHRGEPDDCIYECVVFDPYMLCKHKNDIAGNYIMPIITRTVDISPLIIKKSETYISVNALFKELDKPVTGNELNIYSLLYRLFSSLYKEGMICKSETADRSEKQNRTVNKMLDWAENNFSKNITLADMARVGSLNEKYLCRLFKNYTSMTPIEYINSLRIENACHLMIHSDFSVTDAALESGFNDSSYFTKLFKRLKGITPSAYKKRGNNL